LGGPAALFVCRERRQLALQRYQPAFSSVTVGVHNAFFSPSFTGRWTIRKLEDTRRWKDRKFGKKQFWVDFERDIVVVDTVKRMGEDNPYYQMVPIDPLGMIRLFAKEEGRKIRRLAIGGGKQPTSEGMVMTWAAGPLRYHVDALSGRYTRTHLDLLDWKTEWLMGFQNVEDLLLDDTFEGDEPEGGFQNWDFLKPDYAKKKILSLLENARSQGPEWSAKVPNLRILEEADWKEYL
jgi:hypothetical protein